MFLSGHSPISCISIPHICFMSFFYWPRRVLPVDPTDSCWGTEAAPRKVWVWRLGGGLVPCGFITGGGASGWICGGVFFVGGGGGGEEGYRPLLLWFCVGRSLA